VTVEASWGWRTRVACRVDSRKPPPTRESKEPSQRGIVGDHSSGSDQREKNQEVRPMREFCWNIGLARHCEKSSRAYVSVPFVLLGLPRIETRDPRSGRKGSTSLHELCWITSSSSLPPSPVRRWLGRPVQWASTPSYLGLPALWSPFLHRPSCLSPCPPPLPRHPLHLDRTR
jgi:hypothetical protein